MKFLLTFCLITSLAAVALTSSTTWGRRAHNDHLLHREKVFRNPIRNNYWNVNVAYPKNGQYYGNISAIYVYDRFTNTSGAYPSIVSGGPGKKFATISLRSQYARGINSDVEIYGK